MHEWKRIGAVALLVVTVASIGSAQDTSEREDTNGDEAREGDAAVSTAAPSLRPPELVGTLTLGEPEAPPTARVSVAALVTIAVDGSVSDVTIAESGGGALDQLLIDALRRAQFRPATRDGVPFAVRVRYEHVFEPPPPPPVGALRVEVLDPIADTPVARARVRLATTPVRDAVTDAAGVAQFSSLPPGRYTLEAIRPEGRVVRSEEEVRVDEETVVTLRIAGPIEPGEAAEPSPGALEFGATATVDAPPREVTRRTIEREEMVSVAGTRGDPLRAIEMLPGVARPALASGDLIIRGSSPNDSQVFLEGTPVPLLYHFGGLTSFFQGRYLDRIDFYPGNFSARYGRRIGGVVEIGVNDARPARVGGLIDVNLIDVSAAFEAPLGERGGVAVAARRSWLDTWFGAALGGADGLSLTTAPVYWDYQAIATFAPTGSDRLRLLVYGSSDRLRLLFEDPGDTDPGFRGGVGVRTQFHYVDLHWEHDFGSRVEQEISVSSGRTDIAFDVGENVAFDQSQVHTNLRAEWRVRAHERVRLVGGLDVFVAPFDIAYSGPQPEQGEGNPNGPGGGTTTIAGQDGVRLNASDTIVQPAIYLESDFDLSPVRLLLGVRADYFGIIDEWTVDPRVTALVDVGRSTLLKLGIGTFGQGPELNESSREIGNPSLDPVRAFHLTAGVQQDPVDGIRLGVEGFYKRLWDRVVSTPDGRAPRFTNDGIGRIYGLEVSARVQPRAFDGKFFGFLSYTLSRSERRDGDAEEWRLFDFDQSHIFTLSGTGRLPRNWEVGATFRLVSGNPSTQIQGGIYDPNTDTYTGIPGGVNVDRDPYFHRLDIRIQKSWVYESDRRLSLYLDVQNVYNQQNQEGLSYNYDYTESSPVRGLPIIPSIGLRGEL